MENAAIIINTSPGIEPTLNQKVQNQYGVRLGYRIRRTRCRTPEFKFGPIHVSSPNPLYPKNPVGTPNLCILELNR